MSTNDSSNHLNKEYFEDWIGQHLKDTNIASIYLEFYWNIFIDYYKLQVPIEVYFFLNKFIFLGKLRL